MSSGRCGKGFAGDIEEAFGAGVLFRVREACAAGGSGYFVQVLSSGVKYLSGMRWSTLQAP